MENPEKKIDLERYPLWAQPVVEKHGELVYLITMQSGVAQQAVGEMLEVAQRQNSRKGIAAVQMLGQAFNIVSTALAREASITAEQIADCDMDIRQAFETRNQGRIVVLNQGGIVH